MGIHGLSKLIADAAPTATKEHEIKNYFGRKVAIDASMSIYQFLIAVRTEGQNLTNDEGETTSHLMGMFYRTIRMINNGIKPVYVFDGKPPQMKSGELAKRTERRAQAQAELSKAEEAGDAEEVEKFTRRLVKVLPQHNEDCKQLLSLMGVPFISAPCEAEAQCAALCKAGKVFATATEDMDSLTFESPVLLRHLTFSEARKMPIKEFHLSKVLQEMELNMQEFIDLCILLGCDYCETIRGIGPTRAVALIKQYRSIEKIIENLDKTKYPLPEDWKYQEARELFLHPDIQDPETINLKWSSPDVEGLVEFMCKKNGFDEERIRNAVQKLEVSRTASTQGRMDDFFKVIGSSAPVKRKPEEDKGKAKKGKFAGKGKPK